VPTDLGDEGLFEVERGMEAGSMVVRHPGYGHTDGVSEPEWAGGFATEGGGDSSSDHEIAVLSDPSGCRPAVGCTRVFVAVTTAKPRLNVVTIASGGTRNGAQQ
jgi:hypothetical protein